MEVGELVTVLQSAEGSLVEAIPEAARNLIDIAVGARAAVHGNLGVCPAVGVRGQARTVPSRCPAIQRAQVVTSGVLVPAIDINIQLRVRMNLDPTHEVSGAKREQFASNRIDRDVGHATGRVASDATAHQTFQNDIDLLCNNGQGGTEANASTVADIRVTRNIGC